MTIMIYKTDKDGENDGDDHNNGDSDDETDRIFRAQCNFSPKTLQGGSMGQRAGHQPLMHS